MWSDGRIGAGRISDEIRHNVRTMPAFLTFLQLLSEWLVATNRSPLILHILDPLHAARPTHVTYFSCQLFYSNKYPLCSAVQLTEVYGSTLVKVNLGCYIEARAGFDLIIH